MCKVLIFDVIFLIASVQLIAKGVKNPNVPFHGEATEHSPMNGLQEPGAALSKPQFPVKPGVPVISMTSALKEVGVVGTFVKGVK